MHGRHGLHAQHEGVGEHVSGVRQRVLLPQLAEKVLHGGHAGVVEDKVALEEEVDAPGCSVESTWSARALLPNGISIQLPTVCTVSRYL